MLTTGIQNRFSQSFFQLIRRNLFVLMSVKQPHRSSLNLHMIVFWSTIALWSIVLLVYLVI